MSNNKNKFLVDTCSGTKYYKTRSAALKAFDENYYAHTIAEWNGEQWVVIIERVYRKYKYFLN